MPKKHKLGLPVLILKSLYTRYETTILLQQVAGRHVYDVIHHVVRVVWCIYIYICIYSVCSCLIKTVHISDV